MEAFVIINNRGGALCDHSFDDDELGAEYEGYPAGAPVMWWRDRHKAEAHMETLRGNGWYLDQLKRDPEDGGYVTKTGRVLTDADIEAWAAEAEDGYDVSKIKARPIIRPNTLVTLDTQARLDAVWGAIEALGQIINGDTAGGWTCNEVEALAELCRVHGHDDTARKLIEAHAVHDDDETDQHHDLYQKLTGRA
jgi:hypothetical protein